jgi:dihydrolipoamide dehydrogenase
MQTGQSTAGVPPQSANGERLYDVVVVGAGPIGQTVADRTRAAALSVAVVEQELVGGECSYWGCVPSKALLRPVIAIADARHVDGAREAASGPVNTTGVFGRRDRYVTNWDDRDQADFLRGIGAELVRGHARLQGSRRVAVTTSDDQVVMLAARHAVAICIGSDAALPDIPGIAEARRWTNRRATDSSEVSNRLAVIGGGGVAVEMATAWQGLGSSVTLLARGSGLLPRMEPFAGKLVGQGLAEAGVDVRVGVSVTKLRRPGGAGPVTVSLDDGSELEVDEVLFATGRAPRTGDIGLDTVGLTPGRWLDVDDTCRVRAVKEGWLYAVGDANHRALLTHQGKYQGRIASAAIAARAAAKPVDITAWGAHAATADHHAVPQVFFTDPEAAAVGLTARQAEQAGHRVQVVDIEIWTATSSPSKRARSSPGPSSTPTATPAGPAWLSTSTRVICSASRSSGRACPSCSTPRRSPSRARSPSTGYGTPFHAFPPSPKCGCAFWRPIGTRYP